MLMLKKYSFFLLISFDKATKAFIDSYLAITPLLAVKVTSFVGFSSEKLVEGHKKHEFQFHHHLKILK